MFLENTTFRMEGDQLIPGKSFRAFIHNGGTYFITDVEVYRDSMINCWGLVHLDAFKQHVATGWVVTNVPDGADISMTLGIGFTAVNVSSGVEEQEFVKEIEDAIRELNGQPTSLQVCRDALRAYQAEPSATATERLRVAYNAVPKHRRIFVGDMETKDSLVRLALGL